MFDWISKMNNNQEPMSLLPPGYTADLAKTLAEFFDSLDSLKFSKEERLYLTQMLMLGLVQNELKGI